MLHRKMIIKLGEKSLNRELPCVESTMQKSSMDCIQSIQLLYTTKVTSPRVVQCLYFFLFVKKTELNIYSILLKLKASQNLHILINQSLMKLLQVANIFLFHRSNFSLQLSIFPLLGREKRYISCFYLFIYFYI